MDDIVKAALKKWPNVPACYGWLALDARGDWYMRDDRIQHAGPFPQVKGSAIRHDKLREFIQRNYQADAQGRWYFQNGPQQVFVELEATPWVWRVRWADGIAHVAGHDGVPAQARDCLLDESGRLYLTAAQGLGIVHPQDMLDAAEAVEEGLWRPQEVPAAELPRRYGFVRSPQAIQAAAGR
ncbi:MAG: DUF2946 family protein [Aquabacterium sp.]